MADDGLDPFDSSLRAGLDRLRSVPDRPSVDRRLGAVVTLGHRRRSRRRIAGATAVVLAAVLLSAASGIGRVDGASEQWLRLGDEPRAVGSGTQVLPEVAGSGTAFTGTGTGTTIPAAQTSTTVTAPDPTTPPETTRSTVGPRPTNIGPTITARPGVPDLPPATPSARCRQRDATGGAVVVLDAEVDYDGTCYRISRGTNLRLSTTWPNDELNYSELTWTAPAPKAGQVLGRIVGDQVTDLGPVDEILPTGRWVKFMMWFDWSDHGRGMRGDVYLFVE